MKAPLGWLREYAGLPAELTGRQLSEALIRAGLEVETVESAGADVRGPVVVGTVLSFETEKHSNGKTVRYCRVDVGADNDATGSRGIVCGAHNFGVGDLVVVALPGAELPGEEPPGPSLISARRTYGHLSDGMICSAAELGLGDDKGGILVLTEPDLTPGQDAAQVLHLRDEVLDVAVTPDRGYCLSIRGLARESAQATEGSFTDPVDRDVPTESAGGHPVQLDSDRCPVFVALTVSGLDGTRPSPRWLARRLQLAGMRPISLAVDVTNYVMLETGQPLHAYDADRLAGPIVVRAATAGERLSTLDDVVRELSTDDLVIADDSGVIGLAGVMGGASTELSAQSTAVVIEAAHFDAMTIARTSRRHRLSSEASRRFERGVDPAATYAAAHRAASLLGTLGGGTLRGDETVQGAVPASPSTTMAADLPGRVLGAVVRQQTVVDLLGRVGAVVAPEGERLTITPPTWRPDLRDPYDYVEEVGRLVGFDTVEPVVPRAPVGRGLTSAQRHRRAVNDALAAAGYVEILSFPFTAAVELDRLRVEPEDARRRFVQLTNPLSENQPLLRTTLLPGLFAAVVRNTSRSNDDLALYEAGSVFYARDPSVAAPRPEVSHRPTEAQLAEMEAALPDQPRHLGVVLTGQWRPAGWAGEREPVDWAHAVAFVETAARAVGLTLSRTAAEVAPWHPGRCAQLSVSGTGEVIGFAGELHPQVCSGYGLPARSCAAEIDLDALVASAPPGGEVAALSSYPVAKEDVALIVDRDVEAAEVLSALRRGAGELLESVRLFDVYEGEQVGAGKKSLAFALRLRAPDRTLTDAEAATARDAAVAAAVTSLGAVHRAL